jgi:hypothetical protein
VNTEREKDKGAEHKGAADGAEAPPGADTAAEARLPFGWAHRPPPGWVLSRGWGTARWRDLPRDTRRRLWLLATWPPAAAERN